MIAATPHNQNRLISFLLYVDPDVLEGYWPQIKQVVWNKQNKPIIDLLKTYIKTKDFSFPFSELVISKYPHKQYLGELLSDHVLSTPLAEEEFRAVITLQRKYLLEQAIKKLDLSDPDAVLRKLKEFKPTETTAPSSLPEVKERRILDRELENIAPSTGYRDLDRLIKGFIPGHVYTMTGETNIGKTMTACNFAYRVAKQGKRVLYFALEPGDNIIEYLASIWHQKRFDELTPDDLSPLVQIDVFGSDKVPTLSDMVDIVEESERYDLIVIDHFGYFITGDGQNKTQMESNAIKTIARLAKRKQTAVLSIVHPRKPASDSRKHKMSMNDISGSAAFKQDSTEVLLLVRSKDPADEFDMNYLNEGFILVAKTKSGSTGKVPIRFKPFTSLIQDQFDVAETFV